MHLKKYTLHIPRSEYICTLCYWVSLCNSHELNTDYIFLIVGLRVSLMQRSTAEKWDWLPALIWAWRMLSAATRTTEQSWTRHRSPATSSCCARCLPTPQSTRSALTQHGIPSHCLSTISRPLCLFRVCLFLSYSFILHCIYPHHFWWSKF